MADLIFGNLEIVGGALVALIGMFFARKAVKDAATVKQQKAQIDAMQKAKEVRHEVGNKSDDDVQSDLAGWMRDNDK